jgi:hypothetical protein
MLVRQRVCVGVVGLAAGLMRGRHMGAGHGDLFIGGWRARRARADVERGKPDTMSLYQHDMRERSRDCPGERGARARSGAGGGRG